VSERLSVSSEQLNAFIDNELDTAARADVLDAIKDSPEIAARVADMRHDMDLLSLAFEDPPLPDRAGFYPLSRAVKPAWMAAASIVLLLSGAVAGWFAHTGGEPESGVQFAEVATYSVSDDSVRGLLLHISQMDDDKIDAALNKAEEILEADKNKGRRTRLEIVANADGLGLLRKESPYADRIHSLANDYDNVSFKACGIAMENARLKEGGEIELLPEAEKIPAALGRILMRVEEGWTYIKG